MDLFDAICHSFTTMATGGYSTKQASLAYWDSAYIQYVVIIFMFIAGTNFGLLYVMLHGKFRKLFHDEEFNLELSIRESIFQVVTILTTTGFATADYLLWPPLTSAIIFALLLSGHVPVQLRED